MVVAVAVAAYVTETMVVMPVVVAVLVLPTSRRISPGASTVTPCRATAADMTAERSAWRGLWYDITGVKRRRDDSSERAHPDATSVNG